MALQRIDTAFGPNPIRFNGNLQPQANANVWLGNVSYQFQGVYSNQFFGTATHANLAYYLASGTAISPSSANVAGNIVGYATTVTANISTGAIVSRGGLGVAGVAMIGGNLVAASSTLSSSTTTGALVVTGGVGISGNINVNSSGGNSIVASGAIYASGIIDTLSNTQAISTSSGALQVQGGASITNGNLYIGGSGGTAIVATGNIVPSSNLAATNNIGSDTLWWNTFFGVSTQARYADLAENYQADATYEPGTVLEFGGTAEVTIAEDGTRRVAGVVSTNPAHLMNGGLTGENVVAIALQGRTPCKVRGNIHKGDMLISAGNGFARPDNSPQLGTVIGKALEDFNGIEGVIEVVVGRL